ncbi:MFS transporter [Actinokineospora fastidiosa]|uniref:MFS transporter n=1 Tax=Actinokineospora fastidiosa TaxID=1816 RepID=A0A918GTR6_9PSEU|nr:aromatic acid/H+ symport family MFS transporter [Actinokineospora fastidiosa]GGS57741.1 MFS transporter [Actinokineospora fastidiosa]
MTDRQPVHARPRRPGLVIGLCLLTIVFDGYDLIVFGSVVPQLLAYPDWGLTPAEVGLMGSYALLGMLVGGIAVGAITDLFGRRRTVIGCLTLFSAAMLGCAVAPGPEVFGVLRFVAGIGLGGIAPTVIALTVESAPPHRRNLNNALVCAGFPLGGMLAALLALFFLEPLGFRFMFAVGALPLVTIVPLALWLLPESPAFQRSGGAGAARRRLVSLGRALRSRIAVALVLFAVANFAGLLVSYGLNTWLPQLMRAAGYSVGPALVFLLVLNAGAALGGVLGATLSDRLGPKYVVPSAFLVATASIFLLSVELPAVVLYCLIFVAGASSVGTQIVLFGQIANHFAPGIRATSVGFTSAFGRLGAMMGPLIGGYLAQLGAGFAVNFQIFAAAALLGAIATVLVPARTRHRADAPAPEVASIVPADRGSAGDAAA